MPTLDDLESDLYRRLGFAATPDPVVTTRLRAYLNQTHREILSQKGLHPLRAGIVEATSAPGDPYLTINQAAVRVVTVVDRSNRRVLRPVPLSELREVDPGRDTTSSLPHSFAVINLLTASTKVSTQVGLSLRSTHVDDGPAKTAYFQVIVPGGDPHGVEGVALNGITPVNAPSPWPPGSLVTKFYMNVPAEGFVYIHEGLGGTGAILATIGSGRTTTQKTLLQLYPTPQTAITYHVDVEYRIHEMDVPGDSPLLPEDFHWVLTSGALLKEWQRMEKTAQYDREKAMYREGLGDLKMFVARAQKADGKNGNGNGLHDSSLGPWYPVGGMSSAAPHAPTHEPGGNDPMSVDALPTIGSLRTLGSGPHQAAPGDDPRFLAAGGGPHHVTHESGGSDALSVVLLAGYPGGTTGFLRADATFATPATGGGAHHATHEPGGADAMAVDAAAAVGSLRTLGTGALQAAPGNDARFTAAPQFHATTHQPGGSDAMAVDAIAATGSLRTLGTGSQQAASGTDSRFTNARTPTAHKTTHEPGGGDAMTVDAAAAVGSLRTLGTGANQAAPGNDARFTAAPQLHHATHEPGGGDALVNAAWTNVANTFTEDQTLSYSVPVITLNATSADVDARRFDIVALGAAIQFQAKSDAGVTQATPFSIGRTSAHVSGDLDVIGSGGNVACKDQANTFTAHPQEISVVAPQFHFRDTSQPADARLFNFINLGGKFYIRALNDAGNIQQSAPLTLDRLGDAFIERDVYEKGRTVPMGHWTNVPFSAGNFTVSTGSWTVASGQVGAYAYTLIGKTVSLTLQLNSTTITGAPTALMVQLPSGIVAALGAGSAGLTMDGAGVWATGTFTALAGDSKLYIQKPNLSAFATTLTCYFTLTFPMQ